MTAVIPHPPGRLPLVGDVIGFSPRRVVQYATRDARLLGPIYQRRLFNIDLTFVSGASLVAELSDETRFTKHVGRGIAALRPATGDGLFTAYNHEPNWNTAHEVLMPAFTQAAMRRYHPMMLDVAGELTEKWDRAASSRTSVDVSADMTKMTLETIGRAGFGYSFESFQRERPHPFVTAMLGALAHGQRAISRPPLLKALFGRQADRLFAEQVAYMNNVVDDVIAARTKGDTSNDNDLLGLMLDAGSLDPVNIRYQVITFLAAGHETTSNSLAFALYYLSRDPAVLAQAQSEVDSVWGDGVPAFEQVAKLRYIRRVLDEALRLWPTAPAYGREARADTMLGGRYPMKAGEPAFVLLTALHRDPEVWGAAPERFDPDRFLPAGVKSRPAHVYKPFGTGERACIGRQFALHEAVLVLGLLLRRYHIHPKPDYRLQVQELFTLRPAGFTLQLTRR